MPPSAAETDMRTAEDVALLPPPPPPPPPPPTPLPVGVTLLHAVEVGDGVASGEREPVGDGVGLGRSIGVPVGVFDALAAGAGHSAVVLN